MSFSKQFLRLIIMIMVLSVYPSTALGQTAGDHWAQGILDEWHTKGLLPVGPDSTVIPNKEITRGEFIALINRTFNFTDQQYDLFVDVSDDAWYREDVARSAAAGYISGYKNVQGDYEVRAEQRLSRQEAATILSRVFGFQDEAKQPVIVFSDWNTIGGYAVQNIAYLLEEGYISGYQDHTFRPLNNVTLSEAVTMLNNIAGEIINTKGEYEGTYSGNLVVNTRDVVLKKVVVKGDLYLTQGIGTGDIDLDQVTVHGNTYVNGGGVNSITILNSNLQGMLNVRKQDGKVRILLQGASNIPNVVLSSGAILEVEAGNTSSFGEITIGEVIPGQVITLDGNADAVVIDARGVRVSVMNGALIGMFTITNRANGSLVKLEDGATVSEFVAKADVNVNGEGKIVKAHIQSSNVTLDQKLGELIIDTGLTANVAGQVVSKSIGAPSAENAPNSLAPVAPSFGGDGGTSGPSQADLDQDYVNKTLAELAIDNIEIRNNITLQSVGMHGTGIKWSSDNSTVITSNGKVNRPTMGQLDKTVKLTATITKGNATATKMFTIIVKAKAATGIVSLSMNDYPAVMTDGTNNINILVNKNADMSKLRLKFIIEGSHLMMGDIELKSGEEHTFESVQDIMVLSEESDPKTYRMSIIKVDTVVNTGFPAVIINTIDSTPVLDLENKIDASMLIIDGKTTQYGTGLYNGALTIKGRGNSSWGMPKKSYAISPSDEARMLDMPSDDDWVLIANYADKSLMRNYIAFELGKSLNMAYSPRMRFVEFYLNGEYLGNYLLGEKIKIAPDRLNINKLKGSNNSGSAITGGYLIEKDWIYRLDADDEYFRTDRIYNDNVFNIKEPKSSKITSAQKEYITNYFNEAEAALYGENFKDSDIGYQKYYDTDSLIDWYIVNELYKNLDAAFGTSCYLFKDKDGKIHFGPIWDFDIGAGNVDYDAITPIGFHVKNGLWISRFFEDPAFVQKLKDRWAEIKDVQIPDMFTLITDTESLLNPSAADNFARWEILGTYVWPNPSGYENRTTYGSEVDYLIDWLQQRVDWFNSTIPNM